MENGHLNGVTDAPKLTFKATIGSAEYELKWTFYVEYLLSDRGLTLSDVLAEVNANGKKAAVYAMELVAALITHHFPLGAAPSAAQLASHVQNKQLAQIWQAVLKAGEAAGAIIITPPKKAQAPASAPTLQDAPTKEPTQ